MNEISTLIIKQRIEIVKHQISEAAVKSQRDPDSVRLVIVTKGQPLEVVRLAIESGATELGENYPEEGLLKIQELKNDRINWHMIGHIQSRKAGMVAGSYAMVHSLDSLKLAVKLDQACQLAACSMPVLLEFNVSGEANKFGFPGENAQQLSASLPIIERILDLPNLKVRGLMTMPPFSENPEASRPYFINLRHLADELHQRFPLTPWQDLSMGTSVDFLTAVQEGAKFVRVGQAILGPRPDPKR
jgi:hypothetical protein